MLNLAQCSRRSSARFCRQPCTIWLPALGHNFESSLEKTSMGRPAKSPRLIVVEDCEILKTTNALECLRRGFRFGTVPTRGRGRRLCLLCPRCGRKAFKLYRPN